MMTFALGFEVVLVETEVKRWPQIYTNGVLLSPISSVLEGACWLAAWFSRRVWWAGKWRRVGWRGRLE